LRKGKEGHPRCGILPRAEGRGRGREASLWPPSTFAKGGKRGRERGGQVSKKNKRKGGRGGDQAGMESPTPELGQGMGYGHLKNKEGGRWGKKKKKRKKKGKLHTRFPRLHPSNLEIGGRNGAGKVRLFFKKKGGEENWLRKKRGKEKGKKVDWDFPITVRGEGKGWWS